jgi:hypothetical protein
MRYAILNVPVNAVRLDCLPAPVTERNTPIIYGATFQNCPMWSGTSPILKAASVRSHLSLLPDITHPLQPDMCRILEGELTPQCFTVNCGCAVGRGSMLRTKISFSVGESCGKTTWKGCGEHKDQVGLQVTRSFDSDINARLQVMMTVPLSERCNCARD